mmetsp:Transcript_2135/g.3000  ORF Transcript_2135/g.3000 Transcript_2135/m.3000 type:complete len:205 (-) Transcript_2135:580-1194(-)
MALKYPDASKTAFCCALRTLRRCRLCSRRCRWLPFTRSWHHSSDAKLRSTMDSVIRSNSIFFTSNLGAIFAISPGAYPLESKILRKGSWTTVGRQSTKLREHVSSCTLRLGLARRVGSSLKIVRAHRARHSWKAGNRISSTSSSASFSASTSRRILVSWRLVISPGFTMKLIMKSTNSSLESVAPRSLTLCQVTLSAARKSRVA